MRRSSRAQRIAFCLPPHDTPRAAPCNKAVFCVHCRHAVGGVCKQRMMTLQNYIYRLYIVIVSIYQWIFTNINYIYYKSTDIYVKQLSHNGHMKSCAQ